jgi:hypothetical protein
MQPKIHTAGTKIQVRSDRILMKACPNHSPGRKHKHSGTGVQEKLNLLKACPNQKSTAKTLHAWKSVVVKLHENLYSRISACKSSQHELQHRHKWQKLAQRSSILELSVKLMMRWTRTGFGKVCGRNNPIELAHANQVEINRSTNTNNKN